MADFKQVGQNLGPRSGAEAQNRAQLMQSLQGSQGGGLLDFLSSLFASQPQAAPQAQQASQACPTCGKPQGIADSMQRLQQQGFKFGG